MPRWKEGDNRRSPVKQGGLEVLRLAGAPRRGSYRAEISYSTWSSGIPVTNIVIPLITYDIDVLLDGQPVFSERGRHTPDGGDRIPLHFAGPGAAIVSISQVKRL